MKSNFSLKNHIISLALFSLILYYMASVNQTLLIAVFTLLFALPLLFLTAGYAGQIAAITNLGLLLGLVYAKLGLSISLVSALYIFPSLCCFMYYCYKDKPHSSYAVFVSYLVSLLLILVILKSSFEGTIISGLSNMLIEGSKGSAFFDIYLLTLSRFGLLGSVDINRIIASGVLDEASRLSLINDFSLILPVIVQNLILFLFCSYSIQLSITGTFFSSKLYHKTKGRDFPKSYILPLKGYIFAIGILGFFLLQSGSATLSLIGNILYSLVFSLYLVNGIGLLYGFLRLRFRSLIVVVILMLLFYTVLNGFLALIGVLGRLLFQNQRRNNI